jgi:hypothetical protein
MRFLIDGYNLLHRLGLVRTRMAPGELAGARRRLISLLEKAYGDDTRLACIVFDAAGSSGKATHQQSDQGVDVRYAGRNEIADDVIEDLIRSHHAPKQLTVISDDHRIQRAARRRACRVLGCADYLEELEQKLRPRPPKAEEDSIEQAAPGPDADFWLQTFAPIERDPELRAFFELDRFRAKGRKGPRKSG